MLAPLVAGFATHVDKQGLDLSRPADMDALVLDTGHR